MVSDIVPDGVVNLVPFAALPATTGRYIIDDGPVLHYLAAERDLVSEPGRNIRPGGLLAVGGPVFADPSSFSSGTVPTTPDRLIASRFRGADGCLTYPDLHFEALPATQREVLDIASMWERLGSTSGPAVSALTLTGAAATERAFKTQASGKRVLHMATHGFFLDGLCAPPAARQGTRAVGGLVRRQPVSAGTPSQSNRSALRRRAVGEPDLPPLLRAGLALSGSNRRAAAVGEDDDGILTAEEVAGLDLDGVEWAVLSACDTGVGVIAAGEGVFGLRRAFQTAGARTVIMSLWAIEDRASQVLMTSLYRTRLAENLDTANSIQAAGLTVLNDRRAAGLSTNPFYWAGFVAAGDWR